MPVHGPTCGTRQCSSARIAFQEASARPTPTGPCRRENDGSGDGEARLSTVHRHERERRQRQGGDPLAWSQPEIAHIRDSQRIERESHGKIQHRESNEKESRFASAPIQIAKCRNYYEDEKQAFVEAEIMKSHSAGGRLQCLSCGVIHASDECPRGRGLEADRERKRGNGSGMVMRERTPYAAEGEAEGEHKGDRVEESQASLRAVVERSGGEKQERTEDPADHSAE